MSTAHDVASYILKKKGQMTTMKLQKLIYYCQAWSLVWEDRPIFDEKIQAWANGPVVPALYGYHKGLFCIDTWSVGDDRNLKPEDKTTIEAVLDFYGEKSSQWLSDLTHQEPPWKNARSGLLPGSRGSNEITLADMAEYYGSL